MYSREEVKKLKEEFWTSFGQFMSPIPSADMEKINWAILGPGTIAGDFAKAISEVNGSIYAVGARSIEKSEKFSSDYTVEKVYGNYNEMLKDDKIDVLTI